MQLMPALRLLLFTGLLYSAACVIAAEPGPPAAGAAASPASLPLPSDEELEAAGARIGAIEFRQLQIFDLNDPADRNWLFRTADRLHAGTRLSAIRAQLLFRTGDRYSRRLLQETERNMRRRSNFLREPTIRPIRYHDGVVDIEVTTQDTWTLQPGINFSRSGGTNSSGIDVADSNFLGYGKYAEAGHSEDVDRHYTYLNWADPNVWGTHWTDSVQYSDDSDGTIWGVAGAKPFFSLETPMDYGVDGGATHAVIPRYALGRQYDAYDFYNQSADLYFGDALLISDLWTERLVVGWRVDRNRFTAAPNTALLAPLPQDRDLSFPFTRMQWVENTYETMRDLDLIARTEDVHFGLDASVGLGWATPAFGADRSSLLADTEINYGWRFGLDHQLFLTSRLASRFEDGRMRDAILTGTARTYFATSDRSRFLLRFSGDAGHNLDGDHTLELGGDTGLRGYPLRYQNGNQRALLTIEERLYTNWYLLRLVNVGAAAFYDMGRTWGTTLVPTPQLGLLKDAGVGLRLGNSRAAFGSVIHIDLATPLDVEPGISRLQFLVSTQSSF
jgi:hypothetical protein